MAVSITKYRLLGFRELGFALDKLTEPKFRKAALRRSGKAAMKPVYEEARQLAPVLKDVSRNPEVAKNILKNDIKMSTRTNIRPSKTKSNKIRKTTKHELSVMVKTGKASEDFALVVEYGRDEFVITRTVVFGKDSKEYVTIAPEVKPQPFMRPALYNNYDKVFKIFRTELEKEIAKQAKAQARFLKKKNK